jgi:hypothetical protein
VQAALADPAWKIEMVVTAAQRGYRRTDTLSPSTVTIRPSISTRSAPRSSMPRPVPCCAPAGRGW